METKLIIKRSEWSRGEVGALLNQVNGKKCCLGFHALNCGFTEKEIYGVPDPASLIQGDKYEENKATVDKFGAWLFHKLAASSSCDRLMNANDAPLLFDIQFNPVHCDNSKVCFKSEKERETFIAAEFKKNGIEVTFID